MSAALEVSDVIGVRSGGNLVLNGIENKPFH